ncbi:MAG TPA: lipase family protein [bacterium]|nr:lipase family protein [bacterium]
MRDVSRFFTAFLLSLVLIGFFGGCSKEETADLDDLTPGDSDTAQSDNGLPDISDNTDGAGDDGDVIATDELTDAADDLTSDEDDALTEELPHDGDGLVIDETPDEDTGPLYDPRVEPALCGMTPYHWVQSPDLGKVLEVDQMFGSLTDIAQTSKAALTIIKATLKNDKEVNLQRTPEYDTLVFRIRYRTQDKGQLTDATGIVAIPMTGKTVPVLMVQHGTMGLGDPCSPSAGDELNGTAMVAALFASFGYIAIAPDYLGLKSMGTASTELHSYLIGEPTAIASLDMIRAVPSFLDRPEVSIFGIDVQPGNAIISGGSQGGHAAAFTTRFAPYYAPELTIKGAVWGIPPTDMYRHAKRALNEYVPASGNTALVFLSANDWYRDEPMMLSAVFNAPWDADLRPHALTSCDLDGPLEAAGVDTLEELFTPELLAAAQLDPFCDGFEPWLCYIKENTLARSSVPRIDDIPAFMILSANDTLVVPFIEREAFADLCDMGYQIQYRECTGASHSDGFLWSLDDQLDWLDERYADTPMTDVCTIHPAVKCKSDPN